MPFQSEKQRRYLHANHPEIAKRWERDYANGGISNHFRKKFDKGSDYGQFERRQAHNVAAGSQAMNVGGGQGNQGNGGGGPKPHSGPTFAEIEAQKKAAADLAAANAKKRRDEEQAAIYEDMMGRRKKNIKYYDENLKTKKISPIDSGMVEGALNTAQAVGGLYGLYQHAKNFTPQSFIWSQIAPRLFTKGLEVTGVIPKPEKEKSLEEILEIPDEGTPGRPHEDEYEYDFSDIQGHQAGLTKKQKQALQGSQKNLKNIMGISNEEILENIKMWDDPDDPATVKDIETFYSAKGGVARKNYFHGGILDINESEEIISDDGNDIELTDYNAEFDDPTGVKTLFKAKDGGKTIKGQEHMLAYITPGEAKTLENLGGQKTMTKEGIPAYPPPGEEGGPGYTGGNQNTGNQGSDQGHSRFEPGSGYYGEPVTTSTPKDTGGESPNIGSSLHGGPEFKLTPTQKRDEINKILSRKQVWDKDRWKRDAWTLINVPKTPVGLIPFMISQNKKKNERIAQINEDLRRLEALGYEPHPWEEKDPGGGYGIKGDLEFEKFTLENPNWNKGPDDDKGDGPKPIVKPITLEVDEDYAQGNYGRSLLDRDNAALFAQLSEKWRQEKLAKEQQYRDYGLLPANPIVLNNGGLANLFRVKNQ